MGYLFFLVFGNIGSSILVFSIYSLYAGLFYNWCFSIIGILIATNSKKTIIGEKIRIQFGSL